MICEKDIEIEGNSSNKDTLECGTIEPKERTMGVIKKEKGTAVAAGTREVTSLPGTEKIKQTRRDLSPSQKKGNFSCDGCGKEYRYKRNLTRHVKDQHEITEMTPVRSQKGKPLYAATPA